MQVNRFVANLNRAAVTPQAKSRFGQMSSDFLINAGQAQNVFKAASGLPDADTFLKPAYDKVRAERPPALYGPGLEPLQQQVAAMYLLNQLATTQTEAGLRELYQQGDHFAQPGESSRRATQGYAFGNAIMALTAQKMAFLGFPVPQSDDDYGSRR